MTTTASLLCFTGCAPEPVSTVTINEITAEGLIPFLTGTLVWLTEQTSCKVQLQVQVEDEDGNVADLAGRYQIRLWLSDTDDPSATPTYNPPTTPGASEAEAVTDANGLYEWRLGDSDGVLTTWYVHASIGGRVMDMTDDLGTVGVEVELGA